MNLAETAKLIAKLSDLYPNARFSNDAPATWHELLESIPEQAITAILPGLLADSPEFCPTAGTILRAVRDAIAPTVNVQEAWEKVMRAASRHGAQNPTAARESIGDDVIWKAVKAVGWQRICTADFKDHGTLVAQFREMLTGAQQSQANAERFETITAVSGSEPIALPGGWKKLA